MTTNNFKYGFNVYNYTPEEFLDYSKENKLKHIEINLSKAHSAIKSFDEKRIENLKQYTSNNDIQLSLHLPNETNIADNISRLSRSNIKYTLKAIELAVKLNAKYINCHMGFFFWFPVEKWQRDKALKRFVQKIEEILAKCEETKIVLALENVTPLPEGTEHLLLGDNVNDFNFVFSNLNSQYVKFCLDTGHANLAEGVNSYLDNFSEKLTAIHYHDNNGDDDSHLEVGKGNINWKLFAEKIKEINFEGPFISECRNSKPHEAAATLKQHFE